MTHVGLKSIKRVMSTGLAIAMLTLSAPLYTSAIPAYAARPTPAVPQKAVNAGDHLTNILDREKSWLDLQTSQLALANAAVTFAQTWIQDLQKQSKDASTLESALAVFKQQIAAAQTAHDSAASLLATHTGFDSTGQVTNLMQARQTLKDIHRALIDAHVDLRQGRSDFVAIIVQWRHANNGQA